MSVQELTDRWEQLWAEWYENQARKDAINDELVKVKTQLASAGVQAQRPEPPPLVAA